MADRLLVIRFSSLGDVLLTEPFVRELRRRHPEAVIAYATKAPFAEIVAGWPFDLELYTLPERGSLSALRAVLARFQPRHIYDLHASLRSRLLVRGLPGELHRLRKHYFRRWLTVHYPGRRWTLPFATQRYLALLQDAPVAEPPRWYTFSECDIPTVPVLALVPGSGKFTKSWPVEYWEQLIAALAELPFRLEIFGGPGERALGAQLAALRPAGQVQNYCGELSLTQAATRLRNVELVVTGDTGLLHLAVAVETPVLLLAGSTTRELGFIPTFPGVTILEREELSCRPCSHVGLDRCPREHFACMRELTPALVRETINECLSRGSRPVSESNGRRCS